MLTWMFRDAAMRFLADDTLAERIMVCRGGEPSRLLPLVDWQTALSGGGGRGVDGPVLRGRPGPGEALGGVPGRAHQQQRSLTTPASPRVARPEASPVLHDHALVCI